ncbi:MAG: transcription-repair coupling factor [Bacteroidales bacterium]|nr:transcription-repair coupling factor [Bacteroidales bacterium]
MNKKIKQLSITPSDDRLLSIVDDPARSKTLLTGLYGSAKSFVLARSIHSGVHLAVFPDKESAEGCAADLYHLSSEADIFYLPCCSTQNSHNNVKDSSAKVQRTSAIGALVDYKNGKYPDKFIIVVGYRDSVLEKTVSEKTLRHHLIEISEGDSLAHSFLCELLFNNGFKKVDFVSLPGEFAVRGGLIDIFSYGDDKPYRIDFFGDVIDSIKTFTVNTQRSNAANLKSVAIYPNIAEIVRQEEEDIYSYLTDDAVVWLSDVEAPEDDTHKQVILSSLKRDIRYDNIIEYNTSPQPVFNKKFDILSDDILSKKEKGYSVVIMSENKGQIDRLKNIFSTYSVVMDYEEFTINQGFIDHDNKICLYTDHEIFDRFRRLNLKRTIERSERLTMQDINSFKEGDYVVHIDHGVGRFCGIVKNSINGKIQEGIKIEYRDGDVLIVSIHGLHRISKYRSAEVDTVPKINKLGSGAWEKLKTQTKSKVKDIAQDLIKLYAQRKMATGFSFSPDTYIQQEFESSFQWEETPDQAKAVEAVKADMERSYPMDRLVCGDVGFGKTEVAIRAAFKAVCDSKQVVLLVPTTILALQHYNTFKERLSKFPCNIEYLSRLKSAKEVKDIQKRLEDGKIDIIIGTHRLLGKEVKFKDLGLLIIDEEQKFGVSTKEALRKLKLEVDTLTLTATPIPRTLQFSLFGARDLSIINTAPPNRLPIHTEVIDFNEKLISDIIRRELDRRGQIFFVHNRVQDIYEVEQIIKRIVPELRICVAHGQMKPSELEGKVVDFISGDYDMLLSTTIVENGIDIPNANTIIINRAQYFGLSDLHQLRGRVGRSNRKAFCYLIIPPISSLTEDAARRLRAIEAFSDLGSGFNIAMQDLDIRGMGNMLGAEQSGFITEMGFDTYQKILIEAFEEINGRGDESVEDNEDGERMWAPDCTIDTDMELVIPDDYVNVKAEKLRLYSELDNIASESALEEFCRALEDRFGKMPEKLRQLTFVVKLRLEARRKGIEKVILKGGRMVMYFISKRESPFYKSSRFYDIIKSLSTKSSIHNYKVVDQNNRLYVSCENVRTIEGAYKLLSKL